MKETKKYLIDRWQNEFKSLSYLVTSCLKKGKGFSEINLPSTKTGHFDLRGYSSPKQNRMGGHKGDKEKFFIENCLKISKFHFDNVDLSHTNLECCEFYNCRFTNSIFDQSRLVNTDFIGCQLNSINFKNVNLADSIFVANGTFFSTIKQNFEKVIFNKANLSRASFSNQVFNSCTFENCKTGHLSFNRCHLLGLIFCGRVFNIFFRESRSVHGVNFQNAHIEGFNLYKQAIEGFDLPKGENYYLFSDKPNELNSLIVPKNYTQDQHELWNLIIRVWFRNNEKIEFADLNWLNKEEIEVGKEIIKQLKKR